MLRVLEHPLIPAILTYIVPLLATRSSLPNWWQHPRPKISSYPSAYRYAIDLRYIVFGYHPELLSTKTGNCIVIYCSRRCRCTITDPDMSSDRRTRNVIIIGSTGFGKSSLANIILGQGHFLVSKSRTKAHNEAKHVVSNGIEYNIKLIDTDADPIGTLLDKIRLFIRTMALNEINLIMFVFKEGRVTNHEVIKDLINRFSPIASNVAAVVVTHCEDKNLSARENMKEAFQNDEITKSISDFATKGVFYVGFPALNEIDEQFQSTIETRSKNDRATLHQLVLNESSEGIPTSNLFKQYHRVEGRRRPRVICECPCRCLIL